MILVVARSRGVSKDVSNFLEDRQAQQGGLLDETARASASPQCAPGNSDTLKKGVGTAKKVARAECGTFVTFCKGVLDTL